MLNDALDGMVIYGDLSASLAFYNDYKVSNRIRFPYDGGRLQQPTWVLHNLDLLTLLEERYELQRELGVTDARNRDDGMVYVRFEGV